MWSFDLKKQSERIRGPYQTPSAIQMTTTVFETSDSIRLLRFAILNKRIRVAQWTGIKTVRTKNWMKIYSGKASRPRSVFRLWKGEACFALICFGLFYSYRLFIFWDISANLFFFQYRSLWHQLGKSLGNVSKQQLHCSKMYFLI